MAKRVIDGNGVWLSDKLARVEPVWCRPEYTWIYAIASANGTFEHNLPKIFALCYCRRPDMTMEKLELMFSVFERERLIFRWLDKETNQQWGFFTGSRKPGRLPSASRVQKGHEVVGPEPPAADLEKFLVQGPSALEAVTPVVEVERTSGAWTAIGAREAFGQPEFQSSVEFYFKNRGTRLLSEVMEQAITRCQKSKVAIPPQFFALKRAVEESEGAAKPFQPLPVGTAAGRVVTVRDICPKER